MSLFPFLIAMALFLFGMWLMSIAEAAALKARAIASTGEVHRGPNRIQPDKFGTSNHCWRLERRLR